MVVQQLLVKDFVEPTAVIRMPLGNDDPRQSKSFYLPPPIAAGPRFDIPRVRLCVIASSLALSAIPMLSRLAVRATSGRSGIAGLSRDSGSMSGYPYQRGIAAGIGDPGYRARVSVLKSARLGYTAERSARDARFRIDEEKRSLFGFRTRASSDA